jgi:acetate kinase
VAVLKILVINAGSSSLKASLFELDRDVGDGQPPFGLLWEAHDNGTDNLESILTGLWTGPSAVLPSAKSIDVIGHRVVFGGSELSATKRVDDDVLQKLARMVEYAPAHNAAALRGIETATKLFGDSTPQFAVFDAEFHRTLPESAYTYAGPYAWREKGIRKFGFHGLSHRYASHRASQLVAGSPASLRIVTCHLGSGCSLAAVKDGQSVDTTMGFTPMDGIPMARRSGAIDPGILLHLLRHGGETLDSLDRVLNRDSGLAGLSGTSGDMREILVGVDSGNERAKLALDVFVHHVRQGIASMAASINGIDALVFTGGVGEKAPRVREMICEGLAFLGVVVDQERNKMATGEIVISAEASVVSVLVIPSEENWMIARECRQLVA